MEKLLLIALTTIMLSACGAEEGITQVDEDSATEAAENVEDAATTDDGSAGDSSTDDGSTDDGSTDDGSTDDGSTDDGSTDDGSTDDGSTDDGSTDDGSTDDGSTDDGSTDDGSTDDGSTGDGSTGDGSTGDGSTGDGSTGDGSTGDGSTDDGSTDDGATDEEEVVDATVCTTGSDLGDIPATYVNALEKYTTTNSEYIVYVCTQDTNDDGVADYMVVESTNQPEHESYYFADDNHHHEDFDFNTNKYKYDGVYDGSQRTGPAGQNMIEEQTVVMKMPISPQEATNKTDTPYGTIGLAINGVSFFNENAAPGDDITEELFTFDQCSGHPQGSGLYHYHVDPVCLIRDLGGDVTEVSHTESGTTYNWIEDPGTNAGLLIGFLVDGFPVYGPVGSSETDCNGTTISASSIDDYNGHSHCTAEFDEAIYHYHVKTAEIGGTHESVFWITNAQYFGVPGVIPR